MTAITNAAELFEIPGDVTYLNTAYMAPRLKSVTRAGRKSLDRMAQPWTFGWEAQFEEVERARNLMAGLLNAPADCLAVVHSVSYGIQLAARTLKAGSGSSIVVLQDQFPSNVYAWLELAKATGATVEAVRRPDDGNWTPDLLDAITAGTAIVAIPNCHWQDGSMVDLVAVSARCRAVGAALVLDISQSLGAVPIDVNEIRPDFVVSVCYKWLLGPHGVSMIYADPKHHDKEPLEHHAFGRANALTAGNSHAEGVEYCPELSSNARRFDTASRANLYLMPMVTEALRQIHEWKVERIAATLKPLIARASEWCRELGLRCPAEPFQAPHLLGLRLDSEAYERVRSDLADERIYATYRNGIFRIAPYVFVETNEIDSLFRIIARHCSEGTKAL